MQTSHKTCRSGDAGLAGSPPPNGRMRFRSGRARGPRAAHPSPVRRWAATLPPPAAPLWAGVRPGDKAGPANRKRLSAGGNDPRSCLPAAAPPPLPPGPRALCRPPPALLPRWSPLLNPGMSRELLRWVFLKQKSSTKQKSPPQKK